MIFGAPYPVHTQMEIVKKRIDLVIPLILDHVECVIVSGRVWCLEQRLGSADYREINLSVNCTDPGNIPAGSKSQGTMIRNLEHGMKSMYWSCRMHLVDFEVCSGWCGVQCSS